MADIGPFRRLPRLVAAVVAVAALVGTAPAGAQESDARTVAGRVEPATVEIEAGLAFERGEAVGTGIVLSASGKVLTNNHVIEGSTSITVTVEIDGDERDFDAVVLGASPEDDIALLKVEGAGALSTAVLGDSSELAVGDPVVAIGNVIDDDGALKVTEGEVSGLGRSVTVADGRGRAERLTGLIETSAELAPGNSGGPLVDAAGEVVGMNTAADLQGIEGMPAGTGFAIPIEDALEIVERIEAGDETDGLVIGPTAYLGVSARDLVADGADLGEIPEGDPVVDAGALLIGVEPGGPAEAAGLATGDVIVAFGTETIAGATALVDAVRARDPGERVRVTWYDDAGTRHRARVRLTEGPAA